MYVDPSFRGSSDGGVRYGADAGYFAEFGGTGRGYATRGFFDADYSFRN